ncbi:MAG: cytochrome P450 [Bacteroidota bacterium]|nr:cytochrome P450 [Bacteroidota bacterium]
MTATLFLQSAVRDPYAIYETMLKENPVFWDQANNLWAIYSYENCKAALVNPLTRIPDVNPNNKDGLNEYSLRITGKLARLSNGLQHEVAKQIVRLLFEKRKAIVTADILAATLERDAPRREIDWVDKVCKKLPLMLVLKSFDFKEGDCDFIADNIEHLVKIMSPAKTPEQVAVLNETSKEVYAITEKHLLDLPFYKKLITDHAEKCETAVDAILSLYVVNLIGLFIQCYDAGRGILSNSLLQILDNDHLSSKNPMSKDYFQKSVVETLRFDPPVHTTRRIAADDILFGNTEIKRGQALLIVLAAANRDPLKFNHPAVYDIDRFNNHEHLTFGSGAHACPANYFSVGMATEVLFFLQEKYKKVALLQKNIQYEPVTNARLPKSIFISLS